VAGRAVRVLFSVGEIADDLIRRLVRAMQARGADETDGGINHLDGVNLPSNASKEWSGTRADFAKKVEKMERAVKYLVKRHRGSDSTDEDEKLTTARAKQIKTLKSSVAKVKGFLKEREDRRGTSGKVVKSNITDEDVQQHIFGDVIGRRITGQLGFRF